jgi:hypothetical protein
MDVRSTCDTRASFGSHRIRFRRSFLIYHKYTPILPLFDTLDVDHRGHTRAEHSMRHGKGSGA